MAVVVEVEQARWSPLQRGVALVAVAAGLLARWWALGAPGLSFDEAFTAAYSSLPIGDIPGALRANDSHPPLDYLLRHFVVDTHSELWLRAPSAALSSVALVVVALWMRRRGWFGIAVVAFFALSPFQLLYGRQARMYALMTLIGVLLAVLTERWLGGDRRARVVVAVGALLVVACLDHAGGLLLAVGVLSVPGLGRDRSSWWWRAAPAAAVGAWVVLWATSFLDQASRNTGLWIPRTTPDSLDGAVNGMVSLLEGTRWTVTLLTLGGGIALWVAHRRLGRVWVSLFAVPFLVMALAGLHYHVVLPRTLAASAWAVPVAWAALVQWTFRRWVPVGVAVAALLAVMTLRSVPTAIDFDEGYDQPVATAVAQVQPGDGLLVHPYWLWPLAWWNGTPGRGEPAPPSMEGVDGRYWLWPGAGSTGRTWVVEPKVYRLDTSGWEMCSDWRELSDEWELGCVVTGGS
jgi:hypothetical protein